DRTGGVPLFLDLVEPAHEFATEGIEEYLEEEVLSELEQDEMRLLKIMSTFYQPVHSDAFYLWKGVKHSTVRSLVEKSLLFEVSPMIFDTHDILRDSVSERLGKQTKRTYHKKAAQFHLERDGVEAIVQASFHMIDAGAIKEAIGLLTDNGREIVARGHSEDLYRPLQILESESRYPDVSELAFLMGECLAIRGSWDKAISEYKRYGSLSEKGKDLLGVSASLRRIAGIQRKRGYNREAMKSLEKSAEISKEIGDHEGLADSYYNLAAVFLRTGDLKKSQSYVDKCLATAETSGSLSEIAKAYQIYGVVEEKLGKNKEALRIKRKTVEYAKESGDLHLLNESYTGLGVAYYRLERNDEALSSYEKALESARTTGDVRGTAFALFNMASVYIEKPDLVKAEEYLDESVGILQILEERRMVASTYLSYGFIHKMRGNWTKAEECFKRNLSLVEDIGSPTDLYESYKTIGQILVEKYPRKGLTYLKKASAVVDAVDEVSLRDSLRSEIQSILSKATRRR
ncbi:MAG: tetratricopeptide repeat protein, partial [Methanobacteriota archaeon]